MSADRNLLFGLIALQNGLIDQGQLVAAFQSWTLDRSRPLAAHLVERGELDGGDVAALEGLLNTYIKKYGTIEGSLAAVHASRSTVEELAALGNLEVEASLAAVFSDLTEPGADLTASYTVGTSTSDGRRFRILRPHARGGLGAVFVALDEELHREVALKQILDGHADDPTSRQRFLIEAEITGKLEHPGIVPVYGLGRDGDGHPYYVMRLIRGDSLKEAIQRCYADEAMKTDAGRRSLQLRKLLRSFTDVCNAIEYAHSRGVIHRDIKPANVVIGEHGETLVVDWGIAKPLGRVGPGSQAGDWMLFPSSAGTSAETLPGAAMGTPAYMSPEQAGGDLEAQGPRSDVYSLGATLYCLLTGKPPLEGDDVGAILRAVQKGEFPRPRRLEPSIDRALEAVCLKAMALKPEDRYATPRALAEDVERWLADQPVLAYAEPLWTRESTGPPAQAVGRGRGRAADPDRGRAGDLQSPNFLGEKQDSGSACDDPRRTPGAPQGLGGEPGPGPQYREVARVPRPARPRPVSTTGGEIPDRPGRPARNGAGAPGHRRNRADHRQVFEVAGVL